jgi:hypothetical protein
MRPFTWALKEVESGRTKQTVMHTCSGKLDIVKILRYIRSDICTASSQTRSYYLLPKAQTCSTLSYTSHTMKQSNLIKREQTGQSLQSTSDILKSKHHLTQLFSTFPPPPPPHGSLLLLLFLVDRLNHLMKKLILFFTNK